MKMRISVTIENEDGSVFVDPTTAEISVPEVEAFTSPQVFDQVFYQYEQTVLEARNGVVEEATGKYLSAVGKKNAVGARDTRRRDNGKTKSVSHRRALEFTRSALIDCQIAIAKLSHNLYSNISFILQHFYTQKVHKC